MIFPKRLVLVLVLLAASLPGLTDTASAQIVAIGASNVAGRGVSSSDAWPAQLESMLAAKGRNVHVTNAGISGDTNAGMLARLALHLYRFGSAPAGDRAAKRLFGFSIVYLFLLFAVLLVDDRLGAIDFRALVPTLGFGLL